MVNHLNHQILLINSKLILKQHFSLIMNVFCDYQEQECYQILVNCIDHFLEQAHDYEYLRNLAEHNQIYHSPNLHNTFIQALFTPFFSHIFDILDLFFLFLHFYLPNFSPISYFYVFSSHIPHPQNHQHYQNQTMHLQIVILFPYLPFFHFISSIFSNSH